MTGYIAPESVGLRVSATSFAYRDDIPQDADPIVDLCCEKAGRAPLTVGTGIRHRPVHVAGQLIAGRRAAGLRMNLAHSDLFVFGSSASVPAGGPVTAN